MKVNPQQQSRDKTTPQQLKNYDYLSRVLQAEQIICSVFDYFEVEYMLAKYNTSVQRVVLPRQVAMLLLRELGTLTDEQIGLLFNRDRGVVVSQSIHDKIYTDKQLRESVDKIRQNLGL